jgi:FkbH-like protein
MREPIRLVIWDLDETFWRGTLTEGGIDFDLTNREIVVELARRGIMSSICSKNDFDSVKKILVRHGIWDFFILPSIDWSAKGPRLQALVEAVQLRPPSILFIDDNRSNLEEARRFVPDLNVRGRGFIPKMLERPAFRGRADAAFSRLKQYRLLERRKADERAAGADLTKFLRDSDIRVRLEFDVEPHIDRVVELINRTNQLNFTKVRLPQAHEDAKAELLRLLKVFSIQSALVRVTDRYGDHGFCGVYVHNSEARKLLHFCFSCRILGMGVERWLYQKLGGPQIDIRPDVLTDLFDRTQKIDWINQELDLARPATKDAMPPVLPFGRITARGNCDLGAAIHYFTATLPDAVGEYSIRRNGMHFRIDHTVFLRQAIDGLAPEALSAARRLGYLEEDFRTRLFEDRSDRHLIIFSFATDGFNVLYRHRNSGLTVPFVISQQNRPRLDLRSLVPCELRLDDPGAASWIPAALQFLKDEFDFVGLISESDFKENLRLILKNIPDSACIFILETLETLYHEGKEVGGQNQQFVQLNNWIREVCQMFPRVQILRWSDFISDASEIRDNLHFHRKTYFRIYQGICSRLGLDSERPAEVATP